MHKLPALAGALALLCAPAQSAAQNYTTTAAARKVIAKVVYHRKMTWRFQDRAHRKRSVTFHRERRAELPVLRRLAHYWEHRHYLAWKTWNTWRAAQTVARHATATPFVDSCLSTLIGRESGWDPHATNASGAYGLPQALPGSKMASAGADWADNPATQIRWMVGYVNQRYGGSCAALAHSYAYGWY